MIFWVSLTSEIILRHSTLIFKPSSIQSSSRVVFNLQSKVSLHTHSNISSLIFNFIWENVTDAATVVDYRHPVLPLGEEIDSPRP